ncbi:expressed unknown protein [Seminavis robusta]|uniref:Uncharacterized protein n=1 Tax=Seminavis robusta TaxID=568900 RepID=A0A9N8ER61_9STRA|nr:expressed unknown protein [Seminavis robusta]|eukprot:Sro1715_g293090.1 n/a (436) ;mRNA; r:15070-16377
MKDSRKTKSGSNTNGSAGERGEEWNSLEGSNSACPNTWDEEQTAADSPTAAVARIPDRILLDAEDLKMSSTDSTQLIDAAGTCAVNEHVKRAAGSRNIAAHKDNSDARLLHALERTPKSGTESEDNMMQTTGSSCTTDNQKNSCSLKQAPLPSAIHRSEERLQDKILVVNEEMLSVPSNNGIWSGVSGAEGFQMDNRGSRNTSFHQVGDSIHRNVFQDETTVEFETCRNLSSSENRTARLESSPGAFAVEGIGMSNLIFNDGEEEEDRTVIWGQPSGTMSLRIDDPCVSSAFLVDDDSKIMEEDTTARTNTTRLGFSNQEYFQPNGATTTTTSLSQTYRMEDLEPALDVRRISNQDNGGNNNQQRHWLLLVILSVFLCIVIATGLALGLGQRPEENQSLTSSIDGNSLSISGVIPQGLCEAELEIVANCSRIQCC